MLSDTNTSSNEFAAGEIEAEVYDVAFALLYAAVSSVGLIATYDALHRELLTRS
jgi:hypothetical protein